MFDLAISEHSFIKQTFATDLDNNSPKDKTAFLDLSILRRLLCWEVLPISLFVRAFFCRSVSIHLMSTFVTVCARKLCLIS